MYVHYCLQSAFNGIRTNTYKYVQVLKVRTLSTSTRVHGPMPGMWCLLQQSEMFLFV